MFIFQKLNQPTVGINSKINNFNSNIIIKMT